MKKSAPLWTMLFVTVLSLSGCGGSGTEATLDLNGIIGDGDDPPPLPPRPVGTLGKLTDLGDLMLPQGDHWYYTRATAINNSGVVIGYSNRGSPVFGAYRWVSPAGPMTYLGIHAGTYDDHYDIEYQRDNPRKRFIYSKAVDINSSGVIIGNSTTGVGYPFDEEQRAFVWKAGEFIDITPRPFVVEYFCNPGYVDRRVIGSYSEAVDINDKGEVVLTLQDGPEEKHAYYWDGVSFTTVTLDRLITINPCDGFVPVSVTVPVYRGLCSIVGEDSFAVAINENLHTVINSGDTALFYDLNYDKCESLNHLPLPTGSLEQIKTVAVDINDSKHVNADGIPDPHIVGYSWIDSNEDGKLSIEEDDVQGFFWDGGAMYPVNHLGGGASVVTDINNSDQVVGHAKTAAGAIHAFLWTLGADKRGVIRDLGTLGGTNSYATAINEAGQVTGYSETGAFYREGGVSYPVVHAFLWSNGVMYDLGVHNDFYDYSFVQPYPFSEGVRINDGGQVAGNSITINAHYRGFFLSPVFP